MEILTLLLLEVGVVVKVITIIKTLICVVDGMEGNRKNTEF